MPQAATEPKTGTDDSRIPRLEEVLPGGGNPGVGYAYVLAENIHKAKDLGYQLVTRGESFETGGKPVLIMWKGEAVRATHSIPSLWVDPALDGLW